MYSVQGLVVGCECGVCAGAGVGEEGALNGTERSRHSADNVGGGGVRHTPQPPSQSRQLAAARTAATLRVMTLGNRMVGATMSTWAATSRGREYAWVRTMVMLVAEVYLPQHGTGRFAGKHHGVVGRGQGGSCGQGRKVVEAATQGRGKGWRGEAAQKVGHCAAQANATALAGTESAAGPRWHCGQGRRVVMTT